MRIRFRVIYAEETKKPSITISMQAELAELKEIRSALNSTFEIMPKVGECRPLADFSRAVGIMIGEEDFEIKDQT